MRYTILLILIFSFSLAMAAEMRITVRWDEMAVMGDIEAMLQYGHDGRFEIVRSTMRESSKDGNISVETRLNSGEHVFQIRDAGNAFISIWLINGLTDELFASEEDDLMLAESGAEIVVENRETGAVSSVSVPENANGLVYHAGVIIDNAFYKVEEMYEKKRIYKTSVVNAVNGEPLAGVSVMIKDNRTGEVVHQGLTGEDGFFAVQCDLGKYQAFFSKDKFISINHPFVIDHNELPMRMHAALTPKVQEFRIVLTWGAVPKDLDAHLAGPQPQGGGFHIWWNNKVLIDGKNFLDVDDRVSYGPETVTIYKPAKGTYTYAVHNFSGRKTTAARDLSLSRACVQVYKDGRLARRFDIPPNRRGNVWTVFQIDKDQQINPVNQFHDQMVSARVIP